MTYTSRTNQSNRQKTTVYDKDTHELNENPIIIDKIKNSNEFNRIFNKIFEEVNGESYKMNGYDEWYKSEIEIDKECMNCKTPKDFETVLEKTINHDECNK